MLHTDDPLQKEEFSNWAKAVLSLQIARDGSINYIKSKMDPFVVELDRMHRDDETGHFKELLTKIAVDGNVNESKKSLPLKKRFVITGSSCATCDKIFEKQLDKLKERWHSKNWIHSSRKEQVDPSSYWWILAKIYIAKPGIINAVGPEEVEPSAIFQLISNCKLFDKNLNMWGEKLVKLRNELMHSTNNRLARQEMHYSFDLIKDFLKLVADNETEIISEVEKLEKSTVVLFEENGEFSKLAKEAIELQNISLNADFELPEGIKGRVITSSGASNLAIKQQELKLVECEKKHTLKIKEVLKEKEALQHRLEEAEKKVDQYEMENNEATARNKQPEDIPIPQSPLSKQKQKRRSRSIYQVQSTKDVNVRVASDEKECILKDMCQMSDGTVVVIDEGNKKLKRLDDNFNVRDFYQLDRLPRHVVPVSSSQVAVLDNLWSVEFVKVGQSIVLEKKVDLDRNDLNRKNDELVGVVYCNDQFWVCGRSCIYVYSLAGTLVKCIENHSFGGELMCNRSICTDKDQTKVYVINIESVYELNTDGVLLLKFPIRQSHFKIIRTIDDKLMLSHMYDDSFYFDMYDNEGKILGELITKTNRKPMSLLYDEKKCCLIVGFDADYIQVCQLENK